MSGSGPPVEHLLETARVSAKEAGWSLHLGVWACGRGCAYLISICKFAKLCQVAAGDLLVVLRSMSNLCNNLVVF